MLSVYGEQTTELVIEKSRFLSYAAHAEGEEAARAFLARVRAEHPLATHVCYAFVADKTGNLQRFSDDGEPSGTAGMPILGVLGRQKLFETCVAVVRYFGGIKLGAGGLVRAYSAGAAQVLAAAEKRDYLPCRVLSVAIGYGEHDALVRFLSARPCEIKGTEYAEAVRFSIAVRETDADGFSAALLDCLNGRAEISEKERYFYPFPLANSRES